MTLQLLGLSVMEKRMHTGNWSENNHLILYTNKTKGILGGPGINQNLSPSRKKRLTLSARHGRADCTS